MVLGVLLLLGWAVGARASFNEPLQWKFKVFLDDREIGFHDFTVREGNGTTEVAVDARFDVRVLFINAYRYRHRNAEVWADDCLLRIESATNDNGRQLAVSGGVEDTVFRLTANEVEVALDTCPMSFAYWNPRLLDAQQLLNPQTGEVQPVVVTPRGEERVRYGDETLRAVRYDLAVDGQEIRLWYGAEDYRWLALETPAKGNRLLRYEPVRLPELAREMGR